MSINFSAAGAPSRQVPCDFCKWAVEDGTDRDGRCDATCPGTMTEYDSPIINMSGDNAWDLMPLMGLTPAEYGSVEAAEVPNLLRRIIGLLNRESARQPLLREAGEEQGVRVTVNDETGLSTIEPMARLISLGNTDVQTVRRLENMRDLCVYAVDHGLPIAWS